MATRLTWVIEGLRGGIVTTRYPKQADPVAVAGVRTRPALITERCQALAGCDRCVTACLPNALAIEQADGRETGTFTLDLGRCIGCALCVQECPSEALRMVTDAESATRAADGLRRSARIGVSASEGAER
jgi:formate hydrogenlyase subunit 6/NADH:ubiquinone oxidoreductase subunit I